MACPQFQPGLVNVSGEPAMWCAQSEQPDASGLTSSRIPYATERDQTFSTLLRTVPDKEFSLMYTCSVCSFSGLEAPSADFVICQCCGTEFGYDDFKTTHADLRSGWISRGAKWSSRLVPPPEGWDARVQINNGFPPLDSMRSGRDSALEGAANIVGSRPKRFKRAPARRPSHWAPAQVSGLMPSYT